MKRWYLKPRDEEVFEGMTADGEVQDVGPGMV